MAARATVLGLSAAIAITAYHAQSLSHRYPLKTPSEYHRLPAVLASQSLIYGPVDYMTTRIPISYLPDPLDAYLNAFYSTWTIRLEGIAIGLTGCTPDIPSLEPAKANGLFPVVDRYPTSIIVEWATPNAIMQLFRKISNVRMGGGLQELSAVRIGDEGEIGYAFAQWFEGSGALSDGWALTLHQFYMRFVLDAARRKLVKMQKV